MEDRSLTFAHLAGLFKRIPHYSFAMPPAPVFRQRRDIVHTDCASSCHRRRRGHRLSVHVRNVSYKIAVPEPPVEEDLAKPVEGNMETGAADVAEGQPRGFI